MTRIVEDVSFNIGMDIVVDVISGRTESIASVSVSGFTEGTAVTYTNLDGSTFATIAGMNGLTVSIPGSDETELRSIMASLHITAPPHSDEDFDLEVTVEADTMNTNIIETFLFPVTVLAVADKPGLVVASPLVLDEDESGVYVDISVDSSADGKADDSETLSVRFTLGGDGTLVGTLSELVPLAGVLWDDSQTSDGIYEVRAVGPTATAREAILDIYFMNNPGFTPAAHISGNYSTGILVETISTEEALGSKLADADNATIGTANDIDTSREICAEFIELIIRPVADAPQFLGGVSKGIVQENMNSTIDAFDLAIPVGILMNLSFSDLDGSERVTMNMTGFPLDATALGFTAVVPLSVTAHADLPTGTVTLSGRNMTDINNAISLLSVTLFNDSDENFDVTIAGTVMDESASLTTDTAEFSLVYVVCVQAVADAPSLLVPAGVLPAVQESSIPLPFAVSIGLNDVDLSETYASVVVEAMTNGTSMLQRPIINFPVSSGIVGFDNPIDVSDTGIRYTITGGVNELEAALASLEIGPGDKNGEDIMVEVTVTSIESNPTETNNNGPGIAGNEIEVPTASTRANFIIPVNPVVGTPDVLFPSDICVPEDTSSSLGMINLTLSEADNDGSEFLFLDVDTTNLPPGAVFESGGMEVGESINSTMVRFSRAEAEDLSINPPDDYSGTFTLPSRSRLVDVTTTGSAERFGVLREMVIKISPVADRPNVPSKINACEDVTISVGAQLADPMTGIAVTDVDTAPNNNDSSETIQAIVLSPTTSGPTFSFNEVAPVGDALISINNVPPYVVSITHETFNVGVDLVMLSQGERDTAETEMLDTLALLELDIGPAHTDDDVTIEINVTVLDVNQAIGALSSITYEMMFEIEIGGVADQPMGATIQAIEDQAEDTVVPLIMSGSASVDTDGSEDICVQVAVDNGSVGFSSPQPDFSISASSSFRICYEGSAPNRLNALNTLLSSGFVRYTPSAHFAGEVNLVMDAVTIERFGDSNQACLVEQTFRTTTAFNIFPVADKPSVAGNGVGLEDTHIDIPIRVTLQDNDGSETYTGEVSGVPSGASLFTRDPFTMDLIPLVDVGGTYSLTSDELENLDLLPPANFSSPQFDEVIVLNVTIIVTDAVSDFPDSVESFNFEVPIRVEEVADVPDALSLTLKGTEDCKCPWRTHRCVGSC